MKLIALPFAGGMGNEFKAWRTLLEDEMDLINIQYPGRGARSEMPCAETFEGLLLDIYNEVVSYIHKDEPYMLLGHSMGAIFAYELYFKLSIMHQPLPCHLFLSGNRTPNNCLDENKKADLAEEKFREYFIQLGGISTSVLDDEIQSQNLFKRLRSDVNALESYVYKPHEEPIICGITILNGTHDSFVSDEAAWLHLLGQKYVYQKYEGGHFFIFNQKHAITNYIKRMAHACQMGIV